VCSFSLIKNAATEAIKAWNTNNNPQNKANNIPRPASSESENEHTIEYKTNTGLDYLNVWEGMTSKEPLIREAAKDLINATASCTSAVFTGEGRRNCRLCRSRMHNGYRGHLNECDEYQDAVRNKWCPICNDNDNQ
jgi:hypothetical protein